MNTEKKQTKNDKVSTKDKKALEKIKELEIIKGEYGITEDAVTLKLIIDKMQDKLEHYIKVILQILQPEEFHSLHECTMFNDGEKTELFDIYKSMMILHRELMKTEISNKEEDMISTIEYAHAEMKGYKKHVVAAISKMQESWKKVDTKSTIRYFG